MGIFPEVFSGSQVGLDSPAFATASCDQTPANNSVVQLANPALTGTKQGVQATLLTLTGILVWGAQAAAANVSVWNSSVVNTVATAADCPAVFLDNRAALGNPVITPVGVVTKGNLTPLTPAASTEIFRTALAASQVGAILIPFKLDINPGTSALITVAGSARSIVTLVWVERSQTF